MTQIKLVDISASIVEAWKNRFSGEANVECIAGDITEVEADVWVTPTNSKGHMSGGVDLAIRNHLGPEIQVRVQAAINELYEGLLPVGRAVIVAAPTHSHETPRWVVATPSMVGESDDLRRTKNTALACAAAFQAIYYASDKHGTEIDSIAIPGLGSGTGKIPSGVCADLMLVGYRLFCRKRYDSFDEMLEHLHEELGEVGLAHVTKAGPQPGTGQFMQVIDGGVEKATLPDEGLEKAYTQEEKAELEEVLHVEQLDDPPVKVVEIPTISEGDEYIKSTPIGTPLV